MIGQEGRYEVSNVGRVRSLDRYVWKPSSRRHPEPGGWQQFHKGRVLKAVVGSHGYLVVNIEEKVRLVHRLMLESFVGPCPAGCESLHDDDERLNNTFPNLRWGTRSQNVLDSYRNGRRTQRAAIREGKYS